MQLNNSTPGLPKPFLESQRISSSCTRPVGTSSIIAMTSESAAYGHFLQFCIQYSSIALLYYDYALTFTNEVKYMWFKPFRLPTLLYIFCRYALLANVLYLLAQAGKLHASCNTWYKIDGVISVLGRVAVLATLTFRTYAVFSGSRRILYILCPIAVMCVILDIMHVPGLGCIHSTGSRTAANILSISMVVFEGIAAILTSVGCIMAVRVEGKWRWDSATLHALLFRHGLFYFCFVSLFTVTTCTANFTAPNGSLIQRLPNALTLPVSCLLTARLLLQIREVQATTSFGAAESTISTARAMRSTLRFAIEASILDDFGDNELAVIGQASSDTKTHVEDEIEMVKPNDVELVQQPHNLSAPASARASIHRVPSRDEEAMIEG